MTADEARGIVSDARGALRGVMRAIDRPEPDWEAAWRAASRCLDMCGGLHVGCLVEDIKAKAEDEGRDHA